MDPVIAFSEALARYVVAGEDGLNRVRYRAWKASSTDCKALGDYIGHLQAQRPSLLPDAERMAFWINLYNAVTLQVILERYPVRSIREIRSRTLDPRGLIGPSFERRMKVEGRRLSLSDVENTILRKQFGDPRIHYAINCASNGCPNLQPKVWTGGSLNEELDSAAASFIASPRGVWVDEAGGGRVSRIFKWYAADFEVDGGARSHLQRHVAPLNQSVLGSTDQQLKYDYDWSLNDAEPEGMS